MKSRTKLSLFSFDSNQEYLPDKDTVAHKHLFFSPSTSMSEDAIEDSYYEAEYWGLEDKCSSYEHFCIINPLDYISFILEK